MVSDKILEKIASLHKEGGKVTVDCYDPDCPFGLTLKVGESPVEIRYSEKDGKLVACCAAYDDMSNPCSVPGMVLGDLELELK